VRIFSRQKIDEENNGKLKDQKFFKKRKKVVDNQKLP